MRPRVVFSILCGIAAALTFILFSPSTLTGGNPGGGLAPFLQIPQDTSRARAVTTPADSSKAGLPGAQDSTQARKLGAADSIARDSARAAQAGGGKLKVSDTTYVVCLDSTARLRSFTYRRTDLPFAELSPRRTYPLFASSTRSRLRREIEIDSTGSAVTFRQTYDGVDVKTPVSASFADYLKQRSRAERRRMLADEARRYQLTQKDDDLGKLLTSITQINIPVPPNPIFSIFGKNSISLNISGSVDIKAGFRSTKQDYTTISALDQTRNEPEFSQDVQVNVNGLIGDKLSVFADWNTKREFEYENQLKLKYTGFDDEIVQSVEAGNVSLATPSSFVGSSQALFGIKAKFQMGPLTLTTLASQKKGQIKEVSVSGGAKEQTFEFRAYEYSTAHFFVDTSYIKTFEPYFQNDPPTVDGNLQIVEEEVWVQRQGNVPDPQERQGVAYIDLPSRGTGYGDAMRDAQDLPGRIETGPFVRLDRTQYDLDGDGYIGVLSLKTNVGDQQIVALAYRRADGAQFGELSRDIGTDSLALSKKLILKMVKPKNLISNGRSYVEAWKMLLKNIYSIPGIGRNLKKQGFSMDIVRKVPGGEDQNSIQNQPLLRVLGVDRYNADDTPAPQGDGQFDFRVGKTVNQDRAEIVFPWLRPFDDGVRQYFAAQGTALPPSSEFVYPEVYDTTQTFAQQSLSNRYLMRGKATGEATSKYSLGFNIVEGSVQVLLDGRQLTPNIDYTVDYIIGEVVIRNDQALVPGANLQIKFEQNDLFQLASKSLLGARGDVSLNPTTNFGFTIMNLNQQTLSDKVRLGEEPNTNTIFGIDGSTTIELPLVTKLLDASPFLQTRELSSLKLSGEVAYMVPDPNTKKSSIAGDGGVGVAYIDDFEGVRRLIPAGIAYIGWFQPSPPADNAHFYGVPDTTKMFSKGKMVWFNRLPTDVRMTDVYQGKRVAPENNQLTVLDLEYFPMTRGQFNYSVDLASTLTPTRNWGGIMKPLSISAINLTRENVNFIELWMRLDRVPQDSTARLILDLGVISEDAIPNRQLNSEDLVLGSTPNGTVQEGEDVGLDMLTDDQERARYRTLTDRYPDLAGDPSGDDYAYDNQQQNYGRINGTQGNMNGPGGRVPDTEDLNSNGVVDLANSYFQYEIPLSTDSLQNPYIVSSSSAGWYQFRIPIDGFARKVGLPTQENIESMRLFFAGVSDTIHIRIADISLVGNQWQKLDKTDSSYAVAVVNVEDNPGVYMSPAGVVRERDKTQPDKEVYANEQSMAIVLNGLPDGQSRQVVKFFTYKAYDVFNYRTMKMFVHGDPKFQYTDDSDYDAELFFRFGLDSLNYYEYRSPLRPGWQEGTNDVVINFGDLTAIKQTRDSTTVPSAAIPVPGKPGAFYRVLGNPSLTQIVYLAIGVENPRGKGTSAPLEGQVWVNELRVLSVDDTPGWAYRVDAQFKMADFGTVGVNYSRVDPFFHQLEQKFGSRSLSKNWGLNVSLALDRLLPESWVGTSIPISFSHVEGSTDPRYLPNSDVLVGEATELLRQKIISSGGSPELARSRADSLKLAAQTQRVSNTYAAPNFRIVVPSDWWLIRDTFNKLSYGLNYSESRERSPAVSQHSSWSWNFRLGYSIAFPADYYVAPFRDLFRGLPFLDSYKDFKLFFAPSQFNWSVGFSRSRDQSLQRITGAREILFRNFSGNRNLGYNWKLTEGGLLNLTNDYTINAESSLLTLETDASGNQRPFSSILWDMFVGSGRLINWGQDIRSSQRNQFTFKPSIPDIFGIKRYYDMSFSYSSDYSWSNSLVRGDIGKSAAFSSSTTFSVNVRPKPFFDQLFQTQPATPQQPAAPQTGRGRRTEQPGTVTDTTQRADTSAAQQKKGFDPLDALRTAAVVLVKIPFLDYDNINLTFTQNNSSQNSGVVGRTGFLNYWGRLPFAEPLLEYGPSRMYQLGLVSDPSGRLTNFHFKGSPPFFGWDVQTGLRAKGGVLVNSYRQTNRFTMKTSRSLWEGARLDMSWSLGWNYSRTQNIVTDTLIGIPTIQNTIASGGIDRSFMSIPSSLTFGLVKTGINQVSKIYGQLRADQGDQRLDEEKLAQAFEEGFESLPLFRALFGQYYPRLNWSFRWDGLEKLKLFQGFVSRLSLDHAYNSTFNLQNQDRPGVGTRLTTGERVEAGFSPLVGLNFTFKELAKGNLGATLRYSTSTGYDLATSARNIVERITQELSFTASYTRRGFEIPFFGLSLNNDIDITMNYSVSKNSRKTYDVSRLDVSVKAIPLDGTTRTVMEPRLRYVLSQRVTATIYYRYTSTKPDASGSRIPGSTINEAGLDVRITIQ